MKSWIIIIILVLVAYVIYRNFTSDGKASKQTPKTTSVPEVSQARQTEAATYARLLSNSQEEYFALNNTYASSISALKITMSYGQVYSAKVISANTSNYEIEIRGNLDSDPTDDIWKVTKNGTVHLVNDITTP